MIPKSVEGVPPIPAMDTKGDENVRFSVPALRTQSKYSELLPTVTPFFSVPKLIVVVVSPTACVPGSAGPLRLMVELPAEDPITTVPDSVPLDCDHQPERTCRAG